MAHTDQDDKSIQLRLRQEVEHLNGKLSAIYSEQSLHERALKHVRGVIEEAIILAGKLASVTVVAGDAAGQRKRAEAQALLTYFKEGKRDFESVLAGYAADKVAEKPSVE